MDVVELGGMRLHMVTACPGIPGEAERVLRALIRLGPAVVIGDVDTADALSIRAALSDKKKSFEPGFVDDLFMNAIMERFAPEIRPGEHPIVAAARFARDKRAEFVPLRASADKPSFLARRRATKAVRAIDSKATVESFPHAFEMALAHADVWHADREVEAAHKRLLRVLSDGRAPVVAVLQAHRAPVFEDAVLRTGRIPA